MWSSTATTTKEVKGDTDMESYVERNYTMSMDYWEDESLNDALKDFANRMFEEDFIIVQTMYDKESGKLYRRLSVSVNKKEGK